VLQIRVHGTHAAEDTAGFDIFLAAAYLPQGSRTSGAVGISSTGSAIAPCRHGAIGCK
jgi:hypothetical protein